MQKCTKKYAISCFIITFVLQINQYGEDTVN